MRFQRADTPGILVAAIAPVAMFLLLLNMFGLWQHQGTPLLSVLASVLAVGAGAIGACARFIHHWRVVGGLVVLLAIDTAAVFLQQRTGNDATALATTLKLCGVALFLAVNVAIAYDLVDWGLLPILDRRAARRAQH